MVHADVVNILGGSVHTIKNTETFLVCCKEIGLEVNVDKIKYIVMSRHQNAGRSQNIKTDNSFFERVEELKYLGTTLTNQNLSRKKLRPDLSQGMLAMIRRRIFRLPVFYPKI